MCTRGARSRAAGIGPRHVQRHHRRWRVLDQRLPVRHGVGRQRRHDRRGALSALTEAFLAVSRELALGIVRGGEGATKLISVNVRDARSIDEARQVARTIANSPLVKTAVHGADPNWGRIVAAAGRSGVKFDVQRATVHVGGVLLFENGLPHDDAAPPAAEHLKGTEIQIEVRPRHRWTSGRHDLDLRSERRIRAHQRRVSNVDG